MNVVRLVADTVRRQRSRAGSHVGPSLIADPETEPYKYEIQRLAIVNLTLGATVSTDDKIAAISRIGHLCWTGGLSTAEFTARNYLKILASILSHDEPQSLKLQVVKSLSEICGGSKRNQDLARFQSVIEVIIAFMNGAKEDSETRKWCLHALFYLLCDNEANQVEALRNLEFKRCIQQGLSDDWKGWEYNEAQELTAMMDMNLQYMV